MPRAIDPFLEEFEPFPPVGLDGRGVQIREHIPWGAVAIEQHVVNPPPIAPKIVAQRRAGDFGIFEDLEQAIQHIDGRIVLYANRPAFAKSVKHDQDGIVRVHLEGLNGDDLPDGVPNNPAITDPEFNDFRFDPLGWMNTGYGAVQTSLLPIRQTRRGYGRENVNICSFHNYGADGVQNGTRQGVDIFRLFRDPGFTEMMGGVYPTFNETVWDLTGQEQISVAISRKYVVVADEDGFLWLFREAERIGVINSPKQITLGLRFKWLKEELEASGLFFNVEVL